MVKLNSIRYYLQMVRKRTVRLDEEFEKKLQYIIERKACLSSSSAIRRSINFYYHSLKRKDGQKNKNTKT